MAMLEVARGPRSRRGHRGCASHGAGGRSPARALPMRESLVMAPLAPGEDEIARRAGLEIACRSPDAPEGLAVHLKVDTGMGRWG